MVVKVEGKGEGVKNLHCLRVLKTLATPLKMSVGGGRKIVIVLPFDALMQSLC